MINYSEVNKDYILSSFFYEKLFFYKKALLTVKGCVGAVYPGSSWT